MFAKVVQIGSLDILLPILKSKMSVVGVVFEL